MMIRSGTAGLGLYPDNPCYMPNRPSWLPYWMDTKGEAECVSRGGSFPLPTPPAPAAPQSHGEMLSWEPQDIYREAPRQWDEWREETRAAAREEGVPVGNSTLYEGGGEGGDGQDRPGWWERNKWYLLISVAIIAMLKN